MQTVPEMPLNGAMSAIDPMKFRAKTGKRRTRPTSVNRTIPPRRVAYRELRPREYLTPKEVDRLG
jgi:hypothetical protein